MRQAWWSMAVAGLGIGSLAMAGGTVIGGALGPLAAGYGLLVVLASLYMLSGLAVRDRVWRRLRRPSSLPGADRLAGRRVF